MPWTAAAEKTKAKPIASPAPVAPRDAPRRRVLRGVDGDTVVLEGGERVRLIGVDTPEMKDERESVRYLAKRAAVFLADLVTKQTVRLEYERERVDRFGRTLAYLYLEDGRCVNLEVISQGFGYAFTRYPFRYKSRFKQAERDARQARRGLWAL